MNLDNLSKILPLGSLFIIVCSSINLVIFYKIFDIPIVEYLEAQEYLTLFIDDILLYLLIFGFGLGFHFISLYENKLSADKKIQQKNTKKEPQKKPGNKILRYSLDVLILVLVIFIAHTLFKDIPNSEKASHIGTAFFGILSLSFIHAVNDSKSFPYLLYIALAILSYSIMYAFEDAYEILEKTDLKKYELQINDNTIKTDSTLHYLGKSKNFIFLYNSAENSSEIWKTDDLRKIRIEQ